MTRVWNWREYELVIRGKQTWRPLPGKRAAIWVISSSDTIDIHELQSYAHAFIASETFLNRTSGQLASASLLLQCTDGTRFGPRESAGEQPCLFVGNRRKGIPRKVVEAALGAGRDVEVWGRGWTDAIAPELLAGQHIENSELADRYRGARAVLNDHTPAMLADGFASNRVYDVVACATPLVTEDMEGIPSELRPHLFLYGSLDEVDESVETALESGPEEEALRVALAHHVLQEHTFDQRAGEILNTLAVPVAAG